jgi:transcriptional regulator GlxA family with amidase domain
LSTQSDSSGAALIDILFIVAPHSLLLDLAGPAEAFRLANAHLQKRREPARFRLRFAAASPQTVSSVGLSLAGLEALPSRLPQVTWVVLLGQPSAVLASQAKAKASPDSQAPTHWLAHTLPPLLAQNDEHRLITICSGSLIAARAGLIGTRRVTTHHELLDRLRAAAPAAQVVDNRVFVLDGSLASSAGVTAGIDLSLHLIAQACGEACAAGVAQDMVVYLRRTPNDPELSPLLAHRHHLHAAVHRVQDAVSAEPARDWTMSALAATAFVTERHLLRLFSTHAEVSPLDYVRAIRLERARQALQRGDSVTRAAQDAGFNSDLQLRRAWKQRYGGTPSALRSTSAL